MSVIVEYSNLISNVHLNFVITKPIPKNEPTAQILMIDNILFLKQQS